MGDNGGGQVRITPDDQGPILAINTWFFMVMMILAVIFRLVVKIGIRRSLKLDDWMVCLALAFGIAQSISISVAIGDGLGKIKSNLTAKNSISIEKILYAADILFILSSSCAKFSVLLLLRQLGVTKIHRQIVNVCLGISLAWMVASVFTLAFQCGATRPWDTQDGKCINKFNFWVAISVIDMVTEAVILVIPIIMMIPVQIPVSKKLTVIVAFLFRIGVPIAIIVRLALLHSYYKSTDFSLDSIASGVATQILISVSVTSACVLALKPFLDSFESGALNVALKRSANGGFSSGNGYELHSRGWDNNNNNTNKSHMSSKVRGDGDEIGYAADASRQNAPQRNVSSRSVTSGQSDEMIIKRTDQWMVTTEVVHSSGEARSSSSFND